MKTVSTLTDVRQDFEKWRRKRTGKSRIPRVLWERAVGLLDEYAPSRVAKELRLNQTTLMTWAQSLREGTGTHEQTTFREVTVQELWSPSKQGEEGQLVGRGRIEITRSSGTKVIVESESWKESHLEMVLRWATRA